MHYSIVEKHESVIICFQEFNGKSWKRVVGRGEEEVEEEEEGWMTE